MEILITNLWIAIQIYLGLGLIFSVYFLFLGVTKLDEDAKDTSWTFKLIIMPGVVLLWAILAFKLLKSTK